mmetsp:Transcript_25412/g.32040  ORF Transcript_25412/g.32040 Transcript_25412/m.32040 type:complete len:166 (+) Transcript_25412:116-613(+)
MSDEQIMMTMISCDGKEFPVLPKVARMCGMFANTMEEDDNDITDFRLECPKLNADTLGKVVEYCNHFQTVEEMNEIELPFKGEELDEIVSQKWYSDWANNLTRTQMFGLIEAANYLDIPELLNLMALAWACHIKGKSVEEMQKIFGITPPSSKVSGEDDAEMKEE